MRAVIRRPNSPLLVGLILLVALIAVISIVTLRVETRHRTDPATAGSYPRGSSPTVPNATGLPVFGHVYLIVLENKDAAVMDDASRAPYWNSLRESYASAADYSALYHPSQPNYLALFSGSHQGVTDDREHDLDAPTIADQLDEHGRSWRVYEENYPGDCYTSGSADGGEDGAGTYVRKHNPAISFASIAGNWQRCQDITDFTHFEVGAADYNLIVPNLCHDMHDCRISSGDDWLKAFVPRLVESSRFGPADVLFITFDESEGRDPQNRVATLVVSKLVRPAFSSDTAYTHYSLLRTIEDSWGLGCLAESCEAAAMTDFFSTK